MTRPISGTTLVAGVVGAPIRHSLSPLIHNAWIAAAGIDAVYVAFPCHEDRIVTFLHGLRAGAIRGLNVTLPFKGAALAVADKVEPRAAAAAAANLLLVGPDGALTADNTDGLGLLGAVAAQAPGFDPRAGPVVVVGAGGAARGAVAALRDAGAPAIRIVNRTLSRARDLADAFGAEAYSLADAPAAFAGAALVVNATSAGLADARPLDLPLDATPSEAVVMDMVYKPLLTPCLAQAQALGRRTVDGLEMLIRQAAPSFEAFFGRPPPAEVDVRALALAALEAP
jgi:shikimate dehydrogenase